MCILHKSVTYRALQAGKLRAAVNLNLGAYKRALQLSNFVRYKTLAAWYPGGRVTVRSGSSYTDLRSDCGCHSYLSVRYCKLSRNEWCK